MRRRAAGLAGLAALLLGGCMVGPDYTKPSAPMTPAYKEAEGWKAAEPSDHLPRGQWWAIFGDPELHTLEEEVATANQNLKIAEARLREARAMVRFNRAALFPTISANAGASSVRDSANRPFLTPNATTIPGVGHSSSGDILLGLDMSYEVDLWGKFRTATRAAQRDLVASQYARETVRTVVASDTARFYFNLLAADAQLSLLEDTLKTRVQSVDLQTDRYQAGIIGDYDLGTAQAERASVAGDIAVAKRAVAEFESALTVLLGRSPRDVFTPQLARNVAMSWGTTSMPAIPAHISQSMDRFSPTAGATRDRGPVRVGDDQGVIAWS